ncbi:MAG: permease [Candidatus Margulisbacteria bacterium]|nr:permease [Candidatus Margulisiibacteriota bacterium]
MNALVIILNNFWMFFREMIMFLPLMFVLVGLIDVWFPKEKVEKHINKESGIKGMFLVVLLAMFQAGPLYGAFPVAALLWKKGSSIKNIFIYLGAFSTLKIPMLSFEIGFLGLKFTLLRTLFTLPLFIIIGYIMEWALKDTDFEVKTVEKEKAKKSIKV